MARIGLARMMATRLPEETLDWASQEERFSAERSSSA